MNVFRFEKLHALALLLAASLTLLGGGADAATAQTLRLRTENDLLAGSEARDDLYTFAVALEVERGKSTASLRENAFTDREAGIRFDETYLSVARDLAPWRGWGLAGEAGLVRTGRGIFGERAQNAVHRVLGSESVELRYLPSRLHLRAAAVAERRFAGGDRTDWGPRFEVDLVPGLRSWLLLGAAAAWRPASRIELEARAGARLTRASYAPLAEHLETLVPAVELGVVVDRRFFASWSYGDYGERREHLSAGYRMALPGGSEGGPRARR